MAAIAYASSEEPLIKGWESRGSHQEGEQIVLTSRAGTYWIERFCEHKIEGTALFFFHLFDGKVNTFWDIGDID